MNPPNLPYQRFLRQEGTVQVSFMPASDPHQQEIFNPAAHIYLLTDLFLLCEQIPYPATEQNRLNTSPDMWLLYPPLATKHLKVTRVDNHLGNAFEIEIMRKEVMTIFTESREARDNWLLHFNEAIGFLGLSRASFDLLLCVCMLIGDMTTEGLRVDTNVHRSTSPSSIGTPGGSNRSDGISPEAWQSSSSATTSGLPTLPVSAPAGYFPMSPSSGSSVLNGSLGRPFDHRMSSRSQPSSIYQSLPGLPPGRTPPQDSTQQSTGSPPRQSYAYDYQDEVRTAYPQSQNMPAGLNLPNLPASHAGLRKAPSSFSMGSASSRSSKFSAPSSFATVSSPVPPLPVKDSYLKHNRENRRTDPGTHQDMRAGGLLSPSASHHDHVMAMQRSRSAEGLRQDPSYRMPSAAAKEALRGNSLPTQVRSGGALPSLPGSRMASGYVTQTDDDVSPPSSPKTAANVTSQLAAQMKCKVFIQQAHGQWKSLGTAKLKLYLQSPTNQKQLVVEGDKAVIISTIVLEDGVERVGKTGVAIELSDNGSRTGIVYMLQVCNGSLLNDHHADVKAIQAQDGAVRDRTFFSASLRIIKGFSDCAFKVTIVSCSGSFSGCPTHIGFFHVSHLARLGSRVEKYALQNTIAELLQ